MAFITSKQPNNTNNMTFLSHGSISDTKMHKHHHATLTSAHSLEESVQSVLSKSELFSVRGQVEEQQVQDVQLRVLQTS